MWIDSWCVIADYGRLDREYRIPPAPIKCLSAALAYPRDPHPALIIRSRAAAVPPLPPLLTVDVVETLLALDAGASADVSLDLGRTQVTVRREDDRLLGDGFDVARAALAHEAGDLEEDRVYQLGDGGLEVYEVRAQRYARLMPTADAPALLLDGISMHIARKDTPWRTTRRMAQAVRPSGRRVLDCCSGLGYVAIHCVELGAREVVTIERAPEVLRLRQGNPWSAPLTTDPRIETVIGDVRKFVREQEAASFGAIVHDPPRISRKTGDLYGRPFYSELYRVLRPGGLLLHYIGRPGVTRGKLHVAGVPGRLADVGFVDRRELDDVQSLLVRRPRGPAGY